MSIHDSRILTHLRRFGHRLVNGTLGFSSAAYVWRISADLFEDLGWPETLHGVRVEMVSQLPPNTLYLDRTR